MPKVFHIPVCPFSQRLEILLARKGLQDAVTFEVVDITVPRPDWLLAKTPGNSALPIFEADDGHVLRESLVVMAYLDDVFTAKPIRQADPMRRAIEAMLVAKEGGFVSTGYGFVMNQDRAQRGALHERMLSEYAGLDAFLVQHGSTKEPFLFEDFGWAEAVFTPMFMRFWFLEYYESFALPEEPRFARVRRWVDACRAHPDAQQVTREEIVKVYYDYALGFGNGALPSGRRRSSFVFDPSWRDRPWPPPDKLGRHATDEELGLLA